MHALISTAGVEVKKACEFLLSRQMEDGGWGEEFAVSFLPLMKLGSILLFLVGSLVSSEDMFSLRALR